MRFNEIVEDIDGIILDADGTLLDSMGAWEHVASDYVKSLGIQPVDNLDGIIASMTLEEGAGYIREKHKLEHLTAEDIQSGVLERIDDFYKNAVQMKKGSQKFLETAWKNKIPMIIATTGEKSQIRSALERYGAEDYFIDIIACAEFGSGKDKPEVFIYCMELLEKHGDKNTAQKKEKSRYLVVEDSIMPLKTALECGFKTMGIYDRYSIGTESEMEVFKGTADYFLNSWDELDY